MKLRAKQKSAIEKKPVPPGKPERARDAALEVGGDDFKVAYAAASMGKDAVRIATSLGLAEQAVRTHLASPQVQAAITSFQNSAALAMPMISDTLKEIMLNKGERGSTRVNAALAAAKVIGGIDDTTTPEQEIADEIKRLDYASLLKHLTKALPGVSVPQVTIIQLEQRNTWFNANAPLESRRAEVVTLDSKD